MVGGRRKLNMTLGKGIGLLVLVAVPAMYGACERRPELRILRNMPTVAMAVVAHGNGRLLPSADGPGRELVIPEDVFALSAMLAEIRTSMMPGNSSAAVTVAPGDRVEVLVPDADPQGLCLIRTEFGTYCWLSSGSLVILDFDDFLSGEAPEGQGR